MFDRDKVKNFDEIIEEAEKCGIKVGWSNPCIEIWFHAYFGKMPYMQTSVECVSGFEAVFKHKTGSDYGKSLDNIYSKLSTFGDEANAIKIAKTKHKNEDKCKKPSAMIAITTLYELIEEVSKHCRKKD